MLGAHKFKVGQRVRPSTQGKAAHLFSGSWRGTKRAAWSGVVTAVDRFNSPTVKWDCRKTGSSYAPWFIVPDRRRKKTPAKP